MRRTSFAMTLVVGTLALTTLALTAQRAHAGSHLWKIHEIFSNASGLVQFVELEECCGATGENFVAGIDVVSVSTERVFRFPDHLVGSTARRSLLLATQAFAELPGAPTPDYILPDAFFAIGGDTIWYGPSRNYDSFRFPGSALPLDGRNSLHVIDWRDDSAQSGPPTPTNYAGETGSIDVSTPARFVRGDCNVDGSVAISDPIFLLDALFSGGRLPVCTDACDADDGGVIDISDAIGLLSHLFLADSPLPPPWPDCGSDGTDDSLECDMHPPCA